jgi:hypothetical protein
VCKNQFYRKVVVDLQDDESRAVVDSVDGAFARADATTPSRWVAAVTAAEELGPLRTLQDAVLVSRSRRAWAAFAPPCDAGQSYVTFTAPLTGTDWHASTQPSSRSSCSRTALCSMRTSPSMRRHEQALQLPCRQE